MPASSRASLILIGSVCLMFALLGWGFYAIVFSFNPAQDFMVFYTAARAYLDGQMPLLFDGDAFTAQLNDRFSDWFARPLDLHPWVYPPLFLVLVIPLGLLPFAWAYGSFLVLSFAALNVALRLFIPRGYRRWLCLASLALSPATAFTVAVGQNAFMSAALLVGGFGLLRRSRIASGVCLGVLAYKPQLWLMVPVALLAARAWRALAAALVTAALLALCSEALFGLDPWREWLSLMLTPSPQYESWLKFGRLNGQSVYTEAFLLGAPVGLANLLQGCAILAASGLVWWTFRISRMPADLRLAILLTLTILAAPHVSNYDAVMITVAVSMFLCRALADGFRFGDALLIIIAWSIELLDPPQVFPPGLITPFIYCLFLAALILRARSPTNG